MYEVKITAHFQCPALTNANSIIKVKMSQSRKMSILLAFKIKMATLVVLSLEELRPTIRQVQIARSLTKIALIQLQKRSFRLGIRSMKNSFNSYRILSMYIMNKVTLIKNSLHTLMKKEAFLGKARL